jgi:hypothetical protein
VRAGLSKPGFVRSSTGASLGKTFTPDKPVKTKKPVSADRVSMPTLTDRFIASKPSIYTISRQVNRHVLIAASSLSETLG